MSADKPRRTSDVWVSQDHLDDVLRELRRRRQVTQKRIADEAQVSPAAIARLEKGDRRPSLSMLDKLAAAYQTTAKGIIAAAERIEKGHDPDDVLNELPHAPAAAPDDGLADRLAIAAEVSADPRPAAMSSQPPTPAAPAGQSFTPIQLRMLALANQLEARDDVQSAITLAEQLTTLDPATVTLLAEVAGWLSQVGDSPTELPQLRRELDDLLNRPGQQRQTLAAMPTGEVRYVFSHAIGTDEHGQRWIDPLTRARTAGYDSDDPRVERYDTGQIVVDTSRLDRPEFGPRDPDRHRIKATAPNPTAADGQTSSSSLEQVYARTIIDVDWPDGPTQTITTNADGTTDADLPDDTRHVHLITAHNPRSRLLRHSENQERNRLLHDDLTRAGLHVVAATNRSAHSSWREDSYAVLDADTDTILDLARRYEQNAILHWTPGRIRVVWTDPDASG